MFDWVFPRLHSVRRSTDQKLKQSEQRQLLFCCSNFFCVVFVMSQISFCLCNFNSVFLNYIPFVQSLFECFQKSTHKLHRFYITEFETGFWRRWPTIWFQTELDPTRSCYQYWWYGEILIKTIFGKGLGIPFSTRGFWNLDAALLLNHAILNEMDAKRSSKRCLQRQNWHPRALSTFLAISFFALQFLSFLFGTPAIERG